MKARRMSIYLLAVIVLAGLTAVWWVRNRPQINWVVAEYVPAKTPAHRKIEARLKEERVLERMAEVLSPIKLPRQLTLRTAPCDGDVNAYYDSDEIKICYEYIEALERRIASAPPPKITTRHNLFVGAMADVLLHETGHAVFDMLEIPVFGREEDAADQFSAYIMLQFAPQDARQLIAGATFWFLMEKEESGPTGLEDYASEHGLPAQRFFNYMCLAYGSDAKAFADAVELGKLTADRAEWCATEYAQLNRAFRRLIFPHVDQRELARVRAQKQFRLDVVE